VPLRIEGLQEYNQSQVKIEALLTFIALITCAAAQTPPADIMPLMQEIVQGLGVQCEYCHSAPRGSGLPEPKKDIARQMIAMTRDLNTRVQTATGKPAAQTTQVKCVTCQCERLLGRPVPHRWIWASTTCMTLLRTRYSLFITQQHVAPTEASRA